jgi:tetratricopeptide (TPR) repeat protein
MSKKRKSAAPGRPPAPVPASRRRRLWLLPVAALGLIVLATAAWWVAGRSPPALPATALQDIPWPDTTKLDATAQAAAKDRRAAVEGLQAATPRDDAALGEAYGRLAQLYLAYELKEAAAPALANAATLLPQDFRWPYYQGYLASIGNQADEAAAGYRAALALKPDDAASKIHLAEILRDQHRTSEAQPLLDEVLAADPDSAPAHYILGQLAAEAKDLPTAVERWETALRLQPEASLVEGQLAIAYRDLGDTTRSQEHLAKRGDARVILNDPLVAELVALQSAAGALLTRGGEQMKAGNFDQAAQLFASAATAEPKNALAALNLGAALQNLGKTADAKLAFQAAVALDPGNSQVHYNLGRLAEQEQQPAEAQAAFEQALTADPNNSEAHLALATLQRKAGQCADAAPHFEAYLRDNPTDIKARRLAVLCLAQIKSFAAATALAETGHQVDPKDPVAADLLVRLLATAPDDSVRDGPRALQMAEAMVKDGTFANSELLALAYAEVGRYAEAVAIQEPLLQTYSQDSEHLQWVPYLAYNLNSFKQQQPSREPFPDFAYTNNK